MNTTPMTQAATGGGTARDRWLVAGVVAGLLALGAGFWLVNGTRTFGELILAGLSFCF